MPRALYEYLNHCAMARDGRANYINFSLFLLHSVRTYLNLLQFAALSLSIGSNSINRSAASGRIASAHKFSENECLASSWEYFQEVELTFFRPDGMESSRKSVKLKQCSGYVGFALCRNVNRAFETHFHGWTAWRTRIEVNETESAIRKCETKKWWQMPHELDWKK